MNTSRKTPLPEPTLVFPEGFTLGGPFSRCRAVRLTKEARRAWAESSPQHIVEFGSKHKRGIVLGRYIPVSKPTEVWPEYDVLWSFQDNRAPKIGHGLRYLYRTSDLEGV